MYVPDFGVYLAASFSRKDELKGYRDMFTRVGIRVTSSWLDEVAPAHEHIADQTDDYNAAHAQQNLADMEFSSALVLFSNGTNSVSRGGGRFFEMGYMAALSKPIITVGEPEIIFQYLPGQIAVATVEEALNVVLTMSAQKTWRWLREQDRVKVLRRDLQIAKAEAAETVQTMSPVVHVTTNPDTFRGEMQRQMDFLNLVERG